MNGHPTSILAAVGVYLAIASLLAPSRVWAVVSDGAGEPAAASDTQEHDDDLDAYWPEGWSEQDAEAFAAGTPEVGAAETYTVEAQAPRIPRPGLELDLAPGPYVNDLAESVDAAPGARAVRAGGPLARSELRVRGLGGPRLRVLLDGVPLDDPAGGSVDLTEFESELLAGATLLRGPEAGALAPGAVAGALELRTARPEPGVHARLRSSAGSQGRANLAGRVGFAQDRAALGLSLRMGTSNGDFSYRPVSYSGDSPVVGAPRLRVNNAQTRSSLSLNGSYDDDAFSTRLLVHLAQHQGGLAGLSGHPTPRARFRSDSQLGGTRTLLFVPLGMLSLELSGRTRHEQFVQPDSLAPLATDTRVNTARLGLQLDQAGLFGWLDVGYAVEGNYAGSLLRGGDPQAVLGASGGYSQQTTAERWAGAAVLRGHTELLDHRLGLDAALRLDLLSDLGAEPSASLRVITALARGLFAEAYLGRAFRAPTFYERYGPPIGYTRANPDLEAEDGIEAGALLRWQARALEAELSLFGARLDNTILYLNRNAYEVRPENAGAVWRGGGELSARVQLQRGWSQTAGGELVLSRLDATGAALPTTPLLRLHSRSDLDLAAWWRVLPLAAYLDLRAQSDTASNWYGELSVPAQATLDAGLAWNFARASSLSLEVHNLLDADTRVDLRQVPLPGRQVLLTLVLGA